MKKIHFKPKYRGLTKLSKLMWYRWHHQYNACEQMKVFAMTRIHWQDKITFLTGTRLLPVSRRKKSFKRLSGGQRHPTIACVSGTGTCVQKWYADSNKGSWLQIAQCFTHSVGSRLFRFKWRSAPVDYLWSQPRRTMWWAVSVFPLQHQQKPPFIHVPAIEPQAAIISDSESLASHHVNLAISAPGKCKELSVTMLGEWHWFDEE